MPQGFYKDVTKEISSLGFAYLKPAKGSHEKWLNSKTGVLLIVPKNLNSRHLANTLLKQAGSTKRL